MTTTETEHLMTVAEVAAYLNVRKLWVYQRTKDGVLPSMKCGHYVRIAKSDLDEYLRARRRGGGSSDGH